MRFPDQNIEIILRASCRENAVAKAYSFINGISDREETVICPRSWALWAERGNGFIADFQSSSLAAMRGKKLQDLKDRAAAGTMLHEATHSERLMGTERATEGNSHHRIFFLNACSDVIWIPRCANPVSGGNQNCIWH